MLQPVTPYSRLGSTLGLLFAAAAIAASGCVGDPPPMSTGRGGGAGTGGAGGGAGSGARAGAGGAGGTGGACIAGMPCTTNSDPCADGVTSCSPPACTNGAAKPAGASCGSGQICTAAGTCIPCAQGARCQTNPAAPCKLGAISCSAGVPQCLEDATVPDGTACGVDEICKGGVCTGCAAGTVCTTNPGGACKLGVVACGAPSGCIDGANVSAGTACGSGMVCNGNGQCVGCAAGQACSTNPGAPCKSGVVDCTTGAARCLDAGNTAAGTTCGTNLVCSGGTCVACTAGQVCATNPSPCRNGVTSCATGALTCVDGAPKPSTTPCAAGQMCDGNGFCGACTPNQVCTSNPSSCKAGITACNGTATTCVDESNAPAGKACGVGMVCNLAGACVACAAGQPCAGNPNPCKAGTTSCATGAQTCVDDVSRPAGTACGANMVCSGAGACVACTANANCATNPTPCKTGITSCQTGASVCVDFGNRSAGTPCGTNQVCDGAGACAACTPGQSCTGNPNACASGVTACATGAQVCVDGPAKPAGTACGANRVCNASGQCAACASGQPCTTNPHAACVNGASSCATGVATCVDDTNKAAGTVCGSSMVCSGTGACVACAGGSACTGNPSPCKAGTVSCASGAATCVDGASNVQAGTPCGSNQVCDGNGFCGVCTPGQSCSGNPGACYDGVASCATGSATCINGAAKAAGTSCGTNQVCNGAGTCGACAAGQACSGNPNLCKNGTTICTTGSPVCVDGANKPPGTGCGPNLVCNGAGTCGACTAGQACSNNPNVCKAGMTSCATGVLVCVDGANKPPGSICGTNQFCNGAGLCGPDCTPGIPCASNPSVCKNGVISCATGTTTCLDGGNKAAGISCGTNMVCNGAGTCVACTAGAACTGNPSICRNGVTSCSTGAMTCVDGSNKMGGTSCGTNLTCDGNGNCGACTAGQACSANPNPCYTGITSCATGTLVCGNNAQKPAGTSCGANMVCNDAGACVACTAGVACTTNPSACKVGVTSCATGLMTCIDGGNKTNGASCNDANACTYGDVCNNGTCAGTSYTCAPTQCQTAAVCDGSGGCVTSNKPDGTACTGGDCSCCICGAPTCSAGECRSTTCCNTTVCCTI